MQDSPPFSLQSTSGLNRTRGTQVRRRRDAQWTGVLEKRYIHVYIRFMPGLRKSLCHNGLGAIVPVFGEELCRGFGHDGAHLCKGFGDLCRGLRPNYVRVWGNYGRGFDRRGRVQDWASARIRHQGQVPTDRQAQTKKYTAPSDSAFPMESRPLIMDM